MFPSQAFPSFCVFCYQSVYICAKSANSSESVDKFTKCVSRLTGNNGIANLHKRVNEHEIIPNLKLQCCNDCNIIIDGFCNYYHQLKVLELQINWKLEQIARIINHCNRVPSRWKSMNTSLEETFPDDMALRMRRRTAIRKYRQAIEETSRQRYLQQQPRIMLGMNRDLPTNFNITRQISLQNNTEGSDVNNVIPEENTTSMMSSDMEIEADMSDDNDEVNVENSQQSQNAPLMDPQKKVKFEASSVSPASDDGDIEIQTDLHDDDPDASNFSDDYAQTDGNTLLATTTAPQQQRYSLRKKRKCETLKLGNTNSDNDDRDADFSPETHSERFSDNGSNCSENQDDELPQKSTSSKRQKSITNSGNNSKVGTFHCPKCKAPFKTFSNYRRHLNSRFCPKNDEDDDTGSMKCVECDLICSTREELWVHLSEDHEHIICVECGMEYQSRKQFSKHLERHKSRIGWKFECSHCGKKCASGLAQQEHIRIVHDDGHQNVPRVSNKSILKIIEKKSEWKQIRCQNCSRWFMSKQVYQTHLYSQAKGKFQCESCPLVITNVLKLSTHEYQSHCPDETKEKDRISSSDDGSNAKLQPTCPRCQYKSISYADYQSHFAQIHFQLGNQKCVNVKDNHISSQNHASGEPTDALEKLAINKRLKTCEICDRVFREFSSKVKHLKECHDLPGTPDKSKHLNCQVDKCTAYFLTECQLLYHRVAKHQYKLDRSKISSEKNKASNKKFESFQCPKCNKTFQGLRLFRKHTNICSKAKDDDEATGSVKCEECDLMWKSKKELWLHQNEGHESKVCVECGKLFKTRQEVELHLVYHKDPKDWQWECCSCGRKLSTRKQLKRHINRLHGDGENKTEIFTKSVEKRNDVNPKSDTKSQKDIFKCSNCNNSFRNERVYQNHSLSQHEGKFQCDFCPHMETNVIKLSSHEYQIHGSDETDEQSNGASKLSRWSCPRCKYECAGCADYQFHFAQVHFKVEDQKCVKPTKCEKSTKEKCGTCRKLLDSKKALYRHIKNVHSEVTLTCENCGKGFSNQKNLKQHLERHKDRNEWKWQCSKCGRKLISKSTLEMHMKSHSKEKPFTCKICGDKFKYDVSLKKHLKANHDGEDLLEDDTI